MDRHYEDYKKIIDEHLLDFIPNIDNKSISLYESMKYSLTAGGKRIRPVLLLAACLIPFVYAGVLYHREQKNS